MSELEIDDKSVTALGRNRDAALRVIMPRLLGAIHTYGTVYRSSQASFLYLERGKFCIRLVPEAHYAYLSVLYERRYNVFSARIYSDGAGNAMDRRLYVIGWDRSEYWRQWQADLFVTFAHDTDWLLNLLEKVVKPEVVSEVLSYIARQSVQSA